MVAGSVTRREAAQATRLRVRRSFPRHVALYKNGHRGHVIQTTPQHRCPSLVGPHFAVNLGGLKSFLLHLDASLTHSTDPTGAASRMNSDAGYASESSLPPQAAPAFPSSPPALPLRSSLRILEAYQSSPFVQPDWSFAIMDNNEHRKSEPPSAQQEEGAKSSFKRAYSDETERPPSAQQHREDTDEHDDDLVEEEGEEELNSDPAEKIVDFDWGKLHERYHAAMDNCHKEEGDLTQEFESLMAVRLPLFFNR
jgi:hypothetical protein